MTRQTTAQEKHRPLIASHSLLTPHATPLMEEYEGGRLWLNSGSSNSVPNSCKKVIEPSEILRRPL